MARRSASAPSTDRQTPGRRANGRLVWFTILLIGLTIASLPSMMIIAIGMSPTLVAAVIDRSPKRFALFAVGGMNLSGVFPYLLDLWLGPHTLDHALELLANPFVLLAMFGSAMGGWALYFAVPPIVTGILTAITQRRIAVLRGTQKGLIEEWGEGVANPLEELDGERPPSRPAAPR